MKETDIIRRFMFENASIRGMLVHLDATWRAMLERQHYPDVVRDQLGEFSAAAALLSSTLKYDGSLTMQVMSDGPISMLVMEATSSRTLRGIAKYEEPVNEDTLQGLFGNGRLAITLDNEGTNERYQGIVALEGENIAQALENYLMRSEQLETRLWLATNPSQATGMLIQKMPAAQDEDPDTWNRITHLASTISRDELMELSAEDILHRLFHEDDIRLMEADPVSFRCSCTRERVRNMLRSLGQPEIKSIIEEQGNVSVNCEFCGQLYEFDKVDAEGIFAADIHTDISPTKH